MLGIGKESTRNLTKSSTTYVPYNRTGRRAALAPGTTVGIIAVQAKDYKPGDYNPLVFSWSVSAYRKDLKKVIEQIGRKGQLPKYEQSLFDSCFKNW